MPNASGRGKPCPCKSIEILYELHSNYILKYGELIVILDS
jgi:hypothetical protein